MTHHGFGYRVCDGCGIAVQARVLAAGPHDCHPERYLAHQARRLHWRRGGFEEALRRWLDTPAGRFAEFCARRRPRP
jgi:hypothetical protein